MGSARDDFSNANTSSLTVFLLLQVISCAERLVDLLILGLVSSLRCNRGGAGVGSDGSGAGLGSDGVNVGVGNDGGGVGVGTDGGGDGVDNDGGGVGVDDDGGGVDVCIGVDGSLLVVPFWYHTSSSLRCASTCTTTVLSCGCISEDVLLSRFDELGPRDSLSVKNRSESNGFHFGV